MCPKLWRGGNCKREGGSTAGRSCNDSRLQFFIAVHNRTGITELLKGERIMGDEVRINISCNRLCSLFCVVARLGLVLQE
jgi:hypothetical protein